MFGFLKLHVTSRDKLSF